MKLSTKSTYGLRLCLILADKYCSYDFVSLSNIASEIGTTEKYLEQIVTLLKPIKILESQRGQNGGYRLLKSPKNILVGSILRCLENDLKFVDCIDGCKKENKSCSAHHVWLKLYNEINKVLDSITLDELKEV